MDLLQWCGMVISLYEIAAFCLAIRTVLDNIGPRIILPILHISKWFRSSHGLTYLF